VTFSCLPINLWLVLRIRKRIARLSWLQLQETAEVTRAIDEPIRGIRVVKLFGRELAVIEGVRRAARNAYRFALTRVRVLARYGALLKVVPALSQAALLLLGARAIEGGTLTNGEFLVFFVGSAQVVFFAQSFTAILDQWSFARTGSNRIGELVDPEGVGVGDRMVGDDRRRATTDDAFGPAHLGWSCAELVLAADDRRTQPCTATVAPGTSALVRAPRLVGLPTIGATLVGRQLPAAGTVWVEETDLHDLPVAEARTKLRLLDSEPYLFSRSVRDNLLLGARGADVDDDAIARALAASCADEVVATLPGGLEEVLGDRAMNLSGGQRQRLALAQALLAEPRVLALVEALSGVHAAMEAQVLGRITEAYPDTAVLYLSARPSAASAVDQTIDLVMAVDEVAARAADPVGADVLVAATAEEAAERAEVLAEAAAHTTELPRCGDDADRRDVEPSVRSLASPFRRLIVLATTLMLAITIIDLAPQYLFGEVNDAIDAGSGDTNRYAYALVVLAGLSALGTWCFDILAAQLANGMLYLLRIRLVRRLTRLGLAYYDRELPGYVATRVLHDLDEITAFARAVATRLVVVGLSLVAAVVAMSIIGAQLVVLIGAIVLTAIVVTAVEIPIARRAYLRQRAALGDVIARLEEDYNGRVAIEAAAAADEAVASFDQLAVRLRRAERHSALVAGGYTMAIQWIAEIGGALIMWRSGMLVLGGALTLGAMLTVRLYLARALQPIQELGGLVQQYLRAKVSFDRLHQPYEAAILPVERPDATSTEALRGDIVLDGVGFAYPGTERQVLTDVSLRLPEGQTIAVVGPTGAGKSTLAKLITRVYDPDAGAVRVGTTDLRDLTVASVRARIGVVPQEPFLFAGTIADNVAYGRPDATRAEIDAAIAAVGATEGLAGLAGGLDAVVLEEGINLTPQQRQLTALARAWLVGPDILVLDESTSALDEDTELHVLDALRRRHGTTIFVTHREQVAAAADLRLLVDGTPRFDADPPRAPVSA
ncbi:MAG: ABC transporter ATP-binding protein, partial [Acidimicrobiales bacterium]|nr:ABC transporter ATP-binding protein [Acidimicrobiales bacterium]